MAIYNPGKYYLISVDEEENVCCISPFDVERVEQRLGDVYVFNPDRVPPTVTKVEGTYMALCEFLKWKNQ